MRRLTCLTLLLPVALAAQQPATRALAKAEAEFAEPFDALFSLIELAPGKVLLTDLGPKSVIFADLAAGTQRNVGRNGQGPGEYQFPGDLLPYKGDTVAMADRVSRRVLLIGPAGTIGRSIPFPEGIGGIPELRGADRQGRFYFQASPFGGTLGNGMQISETTPDSVPLLRWDPGAKRVDTVTMVKIPGMKVNTSGGANNRSVMIRSQPYTPTDDWAVTPDGRVVVVRTGEYRVDWYGTGAPVRGAPVKYTRLKVSEADKRRFLEGMRSSRNRIAVTVGGPAPGRSQDNSPPPPQASDFEWPEFQPPFLSRSTLVTAEGEVWVRRTTPAADSTPVYDVFSRAGALTARVTLPMGRRVVGLGKGVLYAARTDEDGLQWLERYRR